jgi:hypothetical protein
MPTIVLTTILEIGKNFGFWLKIPIHIKIVIKEYFGLVQILKMADIQR